MNQKQPSPIPKLKGGPTVRVLVATARADVHDALGQIMPYTLSEALSTRGVYANLPQAQLAIVELDALLEEEIPRDTLYDILNRSRVIWTDPEGFLSNPLTWRAHALGAAGNFESFPPATTAITSYSGGVGKTTLALDAAALFAARTKLPTAVVEFPYGPSPLRAITGVSEGAGFVDVLTSDRTSLPTWRGVTLVTVNYNEVAGFLKPEEVAQRFARIQKDHILTAVDSEFPHPWLDIVAPQIETFLIIAAPRADAWNNATVLSQEMAKSPERYQRPQTIFNLVDGWGDRLTQAGLPRAMDLPRIKNPERLDGRLGARLLRAVYPYWRA